MNAFILISFVLLAPGVLTYICIFSFLRIKEVTGSGRRGFWGMRGSRRPAAAAPAMGFQPLSSCFNKKAEKGKCLQLSGMV